MTNATSFSHWFLWLIWSRSRPISSAEPYPSAHCQKWTILVHFLAFWVSSLHIVKVKISTCCSYFSSASLCIYSRPLLLFPLLFLLIIIAIIMVILNQLPSMHFSILLSLTIIVITIVSTITIMIIIMISSRSSGGGGGGNNKNNQRRKLQYCSSISFFCCSIPTCPCRSLEGFDKGLQLWQSGKLLE